MLYAMVALLPRSPPTSLSWDQGCGITLDFDEILQDRTIYNSNSTQSSGLRDAVEYHGFSLPEPDTSSALR